MIVSASLTRALSEVEVDALSNYGADSTFFHAVAQRREGVFAYHRQYNGETRRIADQIKALDRAIAASTLDTDSVLYSAQPVGFSVRGSLLGDASKFIGLIYQYPGFTSTTTNEAFRDEFLSKRRDPQSRPAILTFQLPAGWNAIDLKVGGHFGEFEFLLARNVPYEVVDASFVDGDVLNLALKPTR
jgi:hypothetical protein